MNIRIEKLKNSKITHGVLTDKQCTEFIKLMGPVFNDFLRTVYKAGYEKAYKEARACYQEQSNISYSR
jgi:hypothetical protein